jgi:TusA-related sulfurtransferase
METFDLSKSIVPFTLLQINNHFNQMQPGETIEVICNSGSMVEDLRMILPNREYEIVFPERPAAVGQEIRVEIKKRIRQSPKPKEDHHVRNRS